VGRPRQWCVTGWSCVSPGKVLGACDSLAQSGAQQTNTMADPAMAFHLAQGAGEHARNTHMVPNKAGSHLDEP
jgi:hypothetical protein